LGERTDGIHKAGADRAGFIPPGIRLRAMERLLRLLQGSNASYGLPEPDHRLGESHPTLNSELLYFLRHGELQARPDIRRWDGKTVTFADGRQDDYDVVIACTGFEIAHPFFDQSFLDYSVGPVPLYLKMIPEHHDSLYFIGLFQPLGCIGPSSSPQSKIMARRMSGAWEAPADLRGAIRHELDHPDVQQLDTPRHTITVDAPIFRQKLLKELPEHFVRRKPTAAARARVDASEAAQ